jgi:hypothetical protein
MEASGESGQCQAMDTGRGQRQRRPRTRLEVLWRARRRGKSWRLARPGRARRMRPPGGGSLGWVRGPGGAAWWGPAVIGSGGAGVRLVRVWSGAGAATVARLGQRWRLPRIWSLWFSSHTVGSLGGGELRWWLWIWRLPAAVVAGWWLSILLLLLGAGTRSVDSR